MDDGVIESNPKNYALLRNEINRLIGITDSIMEYEKLEQTDRETLEIAPLDYARIIGQLQEEYAPLLARQQQRVVIAKNTPSPILFFDESKFIQLLHNIFSNFIKYAGSGKTLTIRAMERDGHILLSFRDNGNGVPRKEIAFVREKFYQVDKSRSASSDRGIGIGLSMVEKIVSLHKGTLSIESDTGKGFSLKMSFAK